MWKSLLVGGLVLVLCGAAQASTARDCDDTCARPLTARQKPQSLTIISDWNRAYVYGYSAHWRIGGERIFQAGKVALGCRAYGRARGVRVVENSCGDTVWVTYRSTRPSQLRLRLAWNTLVG